MLFRDLPQEAPFAAPSSFPENATLEAHNRYRRKDNMDRPNYMLGPHFLRPNAIGRIPPPHGGYAGRCEAASLHSPDRNALGEYQKQNEQMQNSGRPGPTSVARQGDTGQEFPGAGSAHRQVLRLGETQNRMAAGRPPPDTSLWGERVSFPPARSPRPGGIPYSS